MLRHQMNNSYSERYNSDHQLQFRYNQTVNKLSFTKQHDFNTVKPLQNQLQRPFFLHFWWSKSSCMWRCVDG